MEKANKYKNAGIEAFKNKEYEKSIEFHINNINLSESENKFSGNYNLGIIYRNLN